MSKSLFEYEDHMIVLSEVSLVVKSIHSPEYLKMYPNCSEYTVYMKGSANTMGIKESDIERFKTALREYYNNDDNQIWKVIPNCNYR